MEDRIAQALTKLFDRHRIVFWYDSKHELRGEFEAVDLPGIEKREIANNEFGLKYHILREKPEQKFLLYREGPQPADLDNWLLDVQLAEGEFRADQVAIWLAEIGLGLEFADAVEPHAEFYRAARRKEGLIRLLKPDDTLTAIRLKLLAVCAGAEPRMDAIAENLLAELAEGREDKTKLIERCGLDVFLWEQMLRCYGYKSDSPGIRDFVIELFKSCYAMGTDGQIGLTSDALIFLKRWKDSRQFEATFESLSVECAAILGIEQDLARRDFRDLLELDYFRLIDLKIVSDLVKAVASQTVSSGDVALWVRQRKQSHWYGEFRHLYEAIDHASQFMHALNEIKLSMQSMPDAIDLYSRVWFRLDQFYRKFIYHVRMSGQPTLMAALIEKIENLYSNNYLLKLNDRWQPLVDKAASWNADPIPLQSEFFERWVKPILNKDNKVCIIISDALRYEIADEFVTLIRREDRYDAELEPALSMLPSYTQLGMAALLPHKQLELSGNDSGMVQVDGRSSQGTANRSKILMDATNQRATALKSEEVMALTRDECRSVVKEHDALYIYHNRIDATGDKRESEERVFEAVEETLQDLIRLVKKLTGANVNNMLVTSDHGFIYQNRPIEESDFIDGVAEGKQILHRDRRFVLGRGLEDHPGLRKFQSSELGLSGDIEVQIPKSINRLRLKGSGSRFVHGGASLQEVVIPVVRVNKKRQSDLSVVDVDILRGSSSVITSGQLAVTLYQSLPVTDKMQPRELRAGIYTQDGQLISECHELVFDLISDNPRERELQVRFVLTRKADEANNQDVVLRLNEKVPGTSHFREYKSITYQMRRSFTSDFDI